MFIEETIFSTLRGFAARPARTLAIQLVVVPTVTVTVTVVIMQRHLL